LTVLVGDSVLGGGGEHRESDAECHRHHRGLEQKYLGAKFHGVAPVRPIRPVWLGADLIRTESARVPPRRRASRPTPLPRATAPCGGGRPAAPRRGSPAAGSPGPAGSACGRAAR